LKLANMSIRGFTFGALAAGIKHPGSERPDLGLIVSEKPAIAAGVTTTNLVCAAPVLITRKRLETGLCRAVIINSGNANAYTGSVGYQDALEITGAVAGLIGDREDLVLPMSTGVIGTHMPMDRIKEKLPSLVAQLDAGSFMDVAESMLTTDTKAKTVFLEGTVSSGTFKIMGMAKGAGMIAPAMATMLAVIITDMEVDQPFLQRCLSSSVGKSFNIISIDGDTSTNDTALLLSGGHPDAIRLGRSASDRATFEDLLSKACMSLARQIVSDGEGTTKVIEIRVQGAQNDHSAEMIARTIAESLLVKTAFHGEDPNWGRIICAAGRSGCIFDPSRVDLFIGSVQVVSNGEPAPASWENAAHEVMKSREFSVLLDLHSGDSQGVIFTTDLSEEYVTINADYRS
jgi:glutamate N-acetyltransferase / amino-acid N-acetyltransferase